MFCFQCEQTAKGEGCTKIGVCGKQPDVAELQDVLVYAVKGLAQVANEGRKVGVRDSKIDHFACEALFSTLTNVDFDPDRFVKLIDQCVDYREQLKKKVGAAGGWTDYTSGPATFTPASTKEELVSQGENFGPEAERPVLDQDIHSLRETLIYGIKGVAAYADHAAILGKTDDKIFDFIYEGLAATLDDSLGVDDLLGLVLKCGEINLATMELLDSANTGAYGNPEPTEVPLGAKQGKALLVSGHDLKDLEQILKQTEGKGINVYTHGEMLP
ncbi:MAG: hydroxylamine reductase, partial [Desulfobacterales bacterium]